VWLVEVKKIDPEIIEQEQIQDDGKIIRVPVYDYNGEIQYVRTRDVGFKEHWRQPADTPLLPWGLNSLKPDLDVILTEGETDRLTLLTILKWAKFHFNVLAIPGSVWKREWSKHLNVVEGKNFYMVPDNDEAGEKLFNTVKLHIPDLKPLVVPKTYKDLSDFYLNNDITVCVDWLAQQFELVKKVDATQFLSKQEKDTLENLRVPFFSDYIDWVSQKLDAPTDFAEACALMILSIAVGPNFYILTEQAKLRPNLAIILTGSSTRPRKTQSLYLLKEVLQTIKDDVFIANDFSPQGLIAEMSQRNDRTSVLFRDEIAGFFHQIVRLDWALGTEQILIQLLDGQVIKRNLRKEVFEIRNPYFCMIGAGTIDAICRNLSYANLDSGFIPRVAWIVAKNEDLPERKPIILPQHRLTTLEENVKQSLVEIVRFWETNRKSRFGYTAPPWYAVCSEETLARWDKFYADLEKLESENPSFGAIPSRLAWMTLKVAVLLEACYCDYELNTIDPRMEVILKAIEITTKWLNYNLYFLDMLGTSQLESLLNHILSYLDKCYSASRSEIMTKFHLTSRQADEIRDTLLQRHQIEVITDASTGPRGGREVWKR